MKEDITFTPSESLLELADRFSKEFKTTKEEIFKSNDGNYYLHYSDLKERHTGQLVKSYARVGMKSGKIELNRRLLIDNDKINPDFIFYIVLWCVAHRSITNHYKCDEVTLKYYKTTSRSPKDVLIGWLEQAKVTEVSFIKERILKMIDYTKSLFGFNLE